MVFFEAPHRLAVMLAALADQFGADRSAAVCRELTKTYEEVRRGGLGELAAWAADGVRGEITVVVGGADGRAAGDLDDGGLVELVRAREAAGESRKAAIAAVAASAGRPKREVFDAVVAAKQPPGLVPLVEVAPHPLVEVRAPRSGRASKPRSDKVPKWLPQVVVSGRSLVVKSKSAGDEGWVPGRGPRSADEIRGVHRCRQRDCGRLAWRDATVSCRNWLAVGSPETVHSTTIGPADVTTAKTWMLDSEPECETTSLVTRALALHHQRPEPDSRPAAATSRTLVFEARPLRGARTSSTGPAG